MATETKLPKRARSRKPAMREALNDVKGVVTNGPVTEADDTAAVDKTYDRDPARAEFFGFGRGNTVFSFDKEGNVISRKLAWPGEPLTTKVDRHQVRLPIYVDGIGKNPLIPPGLVGITGLTGAGKSTILDAFSRLMPLVRLMAVEPYDNPADVEDVPTYSSADGALAAAVGMMYSHPKVLFAIDSLRAPLFETTGPAGGKGIIMPFFTQLTRVSQQLARAGMTVLFTINPMDDDPDYVKRFNAFLMASLPTTIIIDQAERHGEELVVRGRFSSRPNRQLRTFEVDTRSNRQEDASYDALFTEIAFDPIGVPNVAPFSQNLINSVEKD